MAQQQKTTQYKQNTPNVPGEVPGFSGDQGLTARTANGRVSDSSLDEDIEETETQEDMEDSEYPSRQ